MAAARFPLTTDELADFEKAVEAYILPGYAPPAPFLPRTTRVATIGSCFAENIGRTLNSMGIPVAIMYVDESNNTPAVTDYYFAKLAAKADREGPAANPILAASLVIVTLGVALQKFSSDGPVAVDAEYDKTGNWRMFTVEELTGYMRSIIANVRKSMPEAHIVLTLSPIPLLGSPTHPSVFGQDCLSKSLMRVAIDQVMRDEPPNLTYWPSFEMIRWLGGHVGPFFGGDGAEDNRHVKGPILDAIMQLFIKHYFKVD